MGLFDLFKKKENESQKSMKRKIAYHEIPDEDFVLYEHNWSGKAECGSQWVQFTFNDEQCEVIYNDVHFNEYANPWLETHNTNNAIIDFETIFNSTYSEIISIVNKELELTLTTEQCSDEIDFKKFLSRISSAFRISDSSGIQFHKPSRVGRDHSATHEETVSRLEVQKQILLMHLKDNTVTYTNTAEYYCIVADGTVFKKETEGFYRLDLNKWVWIKDGSLISIWNNQVPVFQEFRDFEDYFPTV